MGRSEAAMRDIGRWGANKGGNVQRTGNKAAPMFSKAGWYLQLSVYERV